LSQFVTNLVTPSPPLGCDVVYGRPHTEYSWSCALTLSLYKNASALVVAESEKA